jgi:drug/metabolite transporter (DMT)-like permease
VPTFYVSALGTVVGFPLFIGLALRHVDAMHAAVVTGLMPLATAVAAAMWFRQRPSNAFWACASAGCGLVVAFALVQGSGRLTLADALLLGAWQARRWAMWPARSSRRRCRAEQVICWVLVLSLPLTLPVAWLELACRQPQRAGVRLDGLRLCHAVLDVARLLRLVPRPGARRH